MNVRLSGSAVLAEAEEPPFSSRAPQTRRSSPLRSSVSQDWGFYNSLPQRANQGRPLKATSS